MHFQNDKVVCGDIFTNGTLVLTNFRIIIITCAVNNADVKNGWAIHLAEVSHLEDCGTFFSKSKRLKIVFSHRKIPLDIGLKFHSGDKDDFLEVFNKVHAKRSWEKRTPNFVVNAEQSLSVTNKDETFSVTNAGIGGIIRRQERNLQSVDALAKLALGDLDLLIEQARDVVTVVQRYAAYIQENRKKDGDESSSETSTQLAEASEMESIMQSIGIVSPVTRLSAGRLYHEQLGRQIADLMHHNGLLRRLGGMITLTDLYCIYNKARGTELVSPNDLLGACEKMDSLKVGIKLRTFSSGVKVLELDDFDNASFMENMLCFINSNRFGTTTGVVSVHFGLSLIVTHEKLLDAEKAGAICRDESVRGLFFHVNKFKGDFDTNV